mgnify:CR=1 FL=1
MLIGAQILLGIATVLSSVDTAIALAHHYFDEHYAKDDFRAVTRVLEAALATGDRIVAAGDRTPYAYYWQGREPAVSTYWLGWALGDHRALKFETLRSPTGTTSSTFAARCRPSPRTSTPS